MTISLRKSGAIHFRPDNKSGKRLDYWSQEIKRGGRDQGGLRKNQLPYQRVRDKNNLQVSE